MKTWTGDPVQVPQSALDELLRRAADVGGFPVAWISFVDGDRELLRARIGVNFTELAPERSLAFADGALDRPLFVEDAAATDWRSHFLVASGPRARFLGVVPLRSSKGSLIGTLTVLDPIPRSLGRNERTALANIASLAVARVEALRDSLAREAPAPAPPVDRFDEESRRRRAAEERYEQERQFVDAVLDNLTGAFYLVSSDGVILRWNAALASAIGYSDAEIGAMKPTDFISASDREAVAEGMRQVFEHGRDLTLEAEVVDRSGNVRPYLLSGRPVSLGGRIYMIGIARDITMRKRTEQQMVRAKERLDLALTSSNLALWDWDLQEQSRLFQRELVGACWAMPRARPRFPATRCSRWNHRRRPRGLRRGASATPSRA